MAPSAAGRFSSVKALQEQLQGEIGLQDQRCTSLSERVRDAELAIAAARAAAEAAESTRAQLARELSMAQRLRTRLLHELANVPIVEGMPAEIWQAIFVDAVESYPITLPFRNAAYDRYRTRVPFRLAAVCRRWRDIALHTSELWTYVALPPQARLRGEKIKGRLVYLIERSRPRPIDVVFSFDKNYDAISAWEHVAAPIIEEFPRWRRAKIGIPRHTRFQDLSFLHRDAPFLEEAYIGWVSTNDAHMLVAPTVLSAWHSLRVFHAPASMISAQISLPSILSLGVVLDVAASLALQLIGQMPTLHDLEISPLELRHAQVEPLSGEIDQVSLVRLQSLTLSGYSDSIYSLLSSLQFPDLRRLVLKAGIRNGMSDDFINLLDDKCSAIETLNFDGLIDRGECWTISVVLRVSLLAFQNLRHLTLSNCSFERLCVLDSVVWPVLETITLRGRTSYTRLDYLEMVTFLGLAAWSAEMEADRAWHGPPHRANFQLYVRDVSPVPVWLPRLMGRIVGPENAHVFDINGKEIPVGPDEDASFTDSEDPASSSSSSGSDWSGDSEGPLLTANGPDWASDVSEDDPSWESVGSPAEDDQDVDDDSDGDASDPVDDDSDVGSAP